MDLFEGAKLMMDLIEAMKRDGVEEARIDAIKKAHADGNVVTYRAANGKMFHSSPLHFGEEKMERFRKLFKNGSNIAKKLGSKLP